MRGGSGNYPVFLKNYLEEGLSFKLLCDQEIYLIRIANHIVSFLMNTFWGCVIIRSVIYMKYTEWRQVYFSSVWFFIFYTLGESGSQDTLCSKNIRNHAWRERNGDSTSHSMNFQFHTIEISEKVSHYH